MSKDKNTVALYVDKDLVNIYKASLDMYEALKQAINPMLTTEEMRKITLKALAKAEVK